VILPLSDSFSATVAQTALLSGAAPTSMASRMSRSNLTAGGSGSPGGGRKRRMLEATSAAPVSGPPQGDGCERIKTAAAGALHWAPSRLPSKHLQMLKVLARDWLLTRG